MDWEPQEGDRRVLHGLIWPLRRLAWPFLPTDVRGLRMQQGVDQDAERKALRVFSLAGVAVTRLGSLPPGTPSDQPLVLRPSRSEDQPRSPWFRNGRLEWDGSVLTVVGLGTAVARFRPSSSGVLPEYRAEEVARTATRPASSASDSPSSVVEIAAVAREGNRMQRLYFLDEASRHLAVTSAVGLVEDDVAELARRAGIGFCFYWISVGPRVPAGRRPPTADLRYLTGRLSPEEVCEAVFPRSVRSQVSEVVPWGSARDDSA